MPEQENLPGPPEQSGNDDLPPELLAPPALQANPAPVRKPRRQRRDWHVSEHLQFALLALTIALFITTFTIQAFRIPSGSMEDTLLVGDYLLVDKTRFGPHNPWNQLLPYRQIRRGEIIVFRYPVDSDQHFVKRVIGLPGDRIRLWHGRVYVNGSMLEEPYIVFKEHSPDEFRDNFPRGNWFNENVTVAWSTEMRTLVHDGVLTVPPGHYFVLGDNRDQSLDSRYWGLVPRENIVGTPVIIYWSYEASTQDLTNGNIGLDHIVDVVAHFFTKTRWKRTFNLTRGYPLQ